ncbi:MAG: hypothetical protein JNJ54_28340 [Myxococcaceae bacterium]|nr:hypothetical protein [Myxococcaceae bacterium]
MTDRLRGALISPSFAKLEAADLSQRGVGFADIPGACERNVVAQIVRVTAGRVVRAWDSKHAP